MSSPVPDKPSRATVLQAARSKASRTILQALEDRGLLDHSLRKVVLDAVGEIYRIAACLIEEA